VSRIFNDPKTKKNRRKYAIKVFFDLAKKKYLIELDFPNQYDNNDNENDLDS